MKAVLSTIALAALSVLGFSTLMAIGGVGSAFIVVPLMFWFGFPLPIAMAAGLLANAISTGFAATNNARNRFISYRAAIPITVLAVILPPVGVYSSRFLEEYWLLWIFGLFLAFASVTMIFYKPKSRGHMEVGTNRTAAVGGGIGAVAGYVSGLLGVGGGSLILPVLVWLGFEPKRASGTTSFVVVFSSLSSFLSRANLGQVDYDLFLYVSLAAMAGGLIGSALMKRFNTKQVKVTIGVTLLLVAAKIMWGLV